MLQNWYWYISQKFEKMILKDGKIQQEEIEVWQKNLFIKHEK